MQRILKEALADCYRLIEGGASVDDCLRRYPQLADELRERLELQTALIEVGRDEVVHSSAVSRGALLSAVASEPVKGPGSMLPLNILPKAAAALAGLIFLGGAAAAAAPQTSPSVSHSVGDVLSSVGVLDRLPDHVRERLENQELGADDEQEEVEVEGEDGDGGGPPDQVGPGTGHDACLAATETARGVLESLLNGEGPFGAWLGLPEQAEPALGEGEAGVAGSLAEIQDCGNGTDNGDEADGPPDGVPPGPPDGVPQGPPEGTPDGPPEGVPQGPPDGTPDGPPDGVPQGLPDGTPDGPPDAVPQGPPEGTPDGPRDVVPPGPPEGTPDGPPDGVPKGPPEGTPDGPPDGVPQGPPEITPGGPPQLPGAAGPTGG